jgi:F-type H+-transporting ATPase subunit b
MKIPFIKRRHAAVVAILAAVLLFGFTGVAFSSSEGGHGEGAETKGWVSTDTYRVMNFAVLAIGLFLLLRKPMGSALSGRIKGIQEQLSELESRKAEAEKELARYNEKLAQLEKESAQIVQSYIKQGEEAKARIIEAAKGAAAKLEEQAKRNISHEFKMAKEKLQAEIVEKSLAKAEEIIKTRITEDDQEKLVDEYLSKVVA